MNASQIFYIHGFVMGIMISLFLFLTYIVKRTFRESKQKKKNMETEKTLEHRVEELEKKVEHLIKKQQGPAKYHLGDKVKTIYGKALWIVSPHKENADGTHSVIKYADGYIYREYHLRLEDDTSVEKYINEEMLELVQAKTEPIIAVKE